MGFPEAAARGPVLLALLLAGCTDVFVLPLGGIDLAGQGDGADLSVAGDAGSDGAVVLDGDAGGGGDGPAGLPASCARLPCVPAANEGDVALSSGTVSGCHAYRTLSIGALSTVTAGRDPQSGLGFAACADIIFVSGVLKANGQGEPAATGPGAGGSCGSGGSHGGKGADPIGCGSGAPYGDPNQPRTRGSGGGPSSGGGAGGGAIELEATTISVIGFVTADGENGSGASGGGGAGGSVLLRADMLAGAGQVTARGGIGLGLGGGGGASTSGAAGQDGTVVKVP